VEKDLRLRLIPRDWDHDGGPVQELSHVHEGCRFALCGPSTVGLLLSSTGKQWT